MSGARFLFPFALLCLIAAGCGSGDETEDPVQAIPAAARTAVSDAQQVDPKRFPAPQDGQTIEAFAAQFDTDGAKAIPASSVFRPPQNRLAFGLLNEQQRFEYGDTVVYVQQHDHSGPIAGPFPAPADVLLTEARYRSAQAATEKDPFAAIYEAEISVPSPGIYNVLAVSDAGDGERFASGMTIEVQSKAGDTIPDVGELAPKVETDTRASVKGDDELLDTRVPPAPELHAESFADVVGNKPVALLFATPQLCRSRVCGPVTDEMLQLRAEYGDQMEFIHQEVFVDNRTDKGLREPLAKFNLRSEPWLFTVDADGRIAARLEGSIGIKAFERAIQAALQR